MRIERWQLCAVPRDGANTRDIWMNGVTTRNCGRLIREPALPFVELEADRSLFLERPQLALG